MPKEMEFLVAQDLVLEERCWACNGTGVENIYSEKQKKNETEVCRSCEGQKTYITTFGQSVLEFVEKHLRRKND